LGYEGGVFAQAAQCFLKL